MSDRDTVFTSTFWRALMAATGSKLHMMTAFHPQADGQSEATNKIITMYLRCFTGDRPRQWLPWAEYTYNTAFQASLRSTPFRVVYGHDSPALRSYEPGESRVVAVKQAMQDRDELLEDVRYRLEQAQAVAKRNYDRKHRAVDYKVGERIWLRVRHRTPLSLPTSQSGKFCPCYYSPTGSASRSTQWRSVSNCLRQPRSMTSSMWASSRSLWVRLLRPRLRYHLCTMERQYLLHSRLSRCVLLGACGRSSSSGRANRHPRLHGRTSSRS